MNTYFIICGYIVNIVLLFFILIIFIFGWIRNMYGCLCFMFIACRDRKYLFKNGTAFKIYKFAGKNILKNIFKLEYIMGDSIDWFGYRFEGWSFKKIIYHYEDGKE